MPGVFSVDAETSSYIDLTSCGADAYTRDLRTRCLMLAFHPVAHPSPPVLWREGDPVPYALIGHLQNGGFLAGWNVTFFDRYVWDRILVPRHGFPPVSGDTWKDSMQLAAMANLPRELAACARSVGVPYEVELKDSNRLRRITDANRTEIPTTIANILSATPVYREKRNSEPVADHYVAPDGTVLTPDLYDDICWLANRCLQDVPMEEQVYMRLPPWPDVEPWIKMPAVDRRINDRGILIDRKLVEGMARACSAETIRLSGEMARVTGDAVDAVTKIEPLKQWLTARGVVLPPGRGARPEPAEEDPENEVEGDDEAPSADEKRGSPWRLRRTDIADILARPDVPDDCREALWIRSEANKASTRKLRAMLAYADLNGFMLGIIKLGGAQQTMRFSSGGPQIHNLVRDVFANFDEVKDETGVDVKKDSAKARYLQARMLALAILAGREGDRETLQMMYERVMRDAQGRERIAGVLTWASRMTRRTVAAPQGYVLLNGDYSSAQARITSWLSGQNDVLAAYARGEDVYRFTASGMYHVPMEQVTKEQRQSGKVTILAGGFGGGYRALIQMAYNYGMLFGVQEAIDTIKRYRQANSMTESWWYAVDDAASWAVMYPGREFPVPPLYTVAYFMRDNCLCCRLPSGRLLRYWAPQLRQEYWPDGRPKDRLSLTALVIKGRAVFRKTIYHTVLCNNLAQAIEADILCEALANMDSAGIPVNLHVHDNTAAPVREDDADRLLPVFRDCMLSQPSWTAGLPIAVEVEAMARFG